MNQTEKIKELKMYLEMYYSMLGKTELYSEEERLDKYIHNCKHELSKYGIYVQEKIKPRYIKI